VSAASGLLSKAHSPDAGATATLTAFGKGDSKLGAKVTVNPDGSFTYDPTASQTIQQLTAQGQDVVDSFDFGVADPKGPTIDPTVTIVIKGGPSPYRYDVVAATASGNYHTLGVGPSINNLGNVAFEGTTPADQGNLYIWPPQNSSSNQYLLTSAKPQAVSILGDWADTHKLFSNPALVPNQTFDERVQINDSNYVIAQRSLAALGIEGSLPFGIPVVTPTPFQLTYAEIYFGGAALAGHPTATAYQVAAGDAGISASGIQWGSPNLMDMALAGLLGAISPALGLAGFGTTTALFTNLMLEPKAWITAPSWGSIFPSPVDSAWEPILWNINRQAGGAAAVQLTSVLALLFELAPDQVLARKVSANDFAAIWPGVSLSNVNPAPDTSGSPPGLPTSGGLPDFAGFNPGYIVFPAFGASGITNLLQRLPLAHPAHHLGSPGEDRRYRRQRRLDRRRPALVQLQPD
jgi:VCBS repeat-containing protein